MANVVYSIKLYYADGTCRTEKDCIYFRYTKDVYVPYVFFEGRFISTAEEIGEVRRVEFWRDDKQLHNGLIDSLSLYDQNGLRIVHVVSKGFTSLLCQNQPEPGMTTNISIRGILDMFPEIINVTCDNSAETVNYLFIKDGSTVWDAICNLAFRLNNIYPFISGTNHVNVKKRVNNTTFNIVGRRIIAQGFKHDFTRLISDIHMQDIQGNYNVFYRTSPEALSRNIVRHKQIPLDRQFLYDPGSAPDYKLRFSMRGLVYEYIRYAGFYAMDLYDVIALTSETKRKIHRIDSVFNGTEIITELGNYNDGFFS